MQDISYSVDRVREYLGRESGDRRDRAQVQAAFEVVMQACEAMGEMLHAAVEREHEAQMAMSALRHPSETVDELKDDLRRLANLQHGHKLFDQLLDELIAEARLEAVQPSGTLSSSSRGHGRAM